MFWFETILRFFSGELEQLKLQHEGCKIGSLSSYIFCSFTYLTYTIISNCIHIYYLKEYCVCLWKVQSVSQMKFCRNADWQYHLSRVELSSWYEKKSGHCWNKRIGAWECAKLKRRKLVVAKIKQAVNSTKRYGYWDDGLAVSLVRILFTSPESRHSTSSYRQERLPWVLYVCSNSFEFSCWKIKFVTLNIFLKL